MAACASKPHDVYYNKHGLFTTVSMPARFVVPDCCLHCAGRLTHSASIDILVCSPVPATLNFLSCPSQLVCSAFLLLSWIYHVVQSLPLPFYATKQQAVFWVVVTQTSDALSYLCVPLNGSDIKRRLKVVIRGAKTILCCAIPVVHFLYTCTALGS